MINNIYISKEHLCTLHGDFPTDMDKLMLLSEECAELIQACQKMYRGLNSPITNNSDYDKLHASLSEEMAHVLICIEAVAYECEVSPRDIQREIDKKELMAIEGEDTYTSGETAGTEEQGTGHDTPTKKRRVFRFRNR